MFAVGPTFFSSSVVNGISPGINTPSSITTANSTYLAPLSPTTLVLAYQSGSSPFAVWAVVVTDVGNGSVAFGTPVQISPGAAAMQFNNLQQLDAATGKYIVIYSNGTSLNTRIFTASGTTITVTGTEDFVASAASLGVGSYSAANITALSPTSVVAGVTTSSGFYGLGGSVAGGTTTTWSIGGLSQIGDNMSSRLYPGPGGVAFYGSKFGVTDNNLWSSTFDSAGVPTAAYLNPTASLRVRTPVSGSIPTVGVAISSGQAALVAKTLAGGFYYTIAQTSGAVTTFSNYDSMPNLISGGPYTSPADPTSGTMASHGGSKLVHVYKQGTQFWGASMTISGNINMAANVIDLTGATAVVGSRPGVEFLNANRFMLIWSAGGFVRGQVCTIS